MSRCSICLASGRGQLDLLISTVSSARQSLTYCHLGQHVCLSVCNSCDNLCVISSLADYATRRPNMSASAGRDYRQSLMLIVTSKQQVLDSRLNEDFPITSYQHLLNCWTSQESHDGGDKSTGFRSDWAIWVIPSHMFTRCLLLHTFQKTVCLQEPRSSVVTFTV